MLSNPSTVVIASRRYLFAKNTCTYDELSDEELREVLEYATRTNNALNNENEIFEYFLQRKAPQLLKSKSYAFLLTLPPAHVLVNITFVDRKAFREMSHIIKLAIQAQSAYHTANPEVMDPGTGDSNVSLTGSGMTETQQDNVSSNISFRPQSGNSAQPGTSSGQGSGHRRIALTFKVTPAHRVVLVHKVIDEIKKLSVAFIRDIKKQLGDLEAKLTEMKERIMDNDQMIKRFELDIMTRVDPVTKQISSDKFIRFVNNQLKVCDNLIDKFNLKTITNKRLITQTKKQIKQLERRGETLSPIDVVKLDIENRNLNAENLRNQQMINSLTKNNGHFGLLLKNFKDKLIEKKELLKQTENRIKLQMQEKIYLREYKARAIWELRKTTDQLNSIKALKEMYKAPDVPDFLEVQEQLQEMKKMVKRLSRRRKLKLVLARQSKLKND